MAEIQQLSPRRREVFDLIIAGKGNREIAMAMEISYHTVISHRRAIMLCLGTSNAVQLTMLASRAGVLR